MPFLAAASHGSAENKARSPVTPNNAKQNAPAQGRGKNRRTRKKAFG